MNAAEGAVVCYLTSVTKPGIRGWLMKYDVEAYDGIGDIVVTPDRARAMVFKNGLEALAAWKSVPKARPLRDDGKPNRPLTAFHMEISLVPLAPESWTEALYESKPIKVEGDAPQIATEDQRDSGAWRRER